MSDAKELAYDLDWYADAMQGEIAGGNDSPEDRAKAAVWIALNREAAALLREQAEEIELLRQAWGTDAKAAEIGDWPEDIAGRFAFDDVRARCAKAIRAYGDRRAAETEARLRECLATEYERGKREGAGPSSAQARAASPGGVRPKASIGGKG